jgi:hypothetical protein
MILECHGDYWTAYGTVCGKRILAEADTKTEAMWHWKQMANETYRHIKDMEKLLELFL